MTSILISALAVAMPGQIQTDLRLLRYPAISGDTLVYTYAGDLWSWTIGGPPAKRLTTHPGEEMRAKISPDGKTIAFTGAYDGGQDLFVMPIEGGSPRRLTFEPGPEFAACWTPDGKIAYVSSYGGINGTQPRLRLIDPDGGMPESTPILEAAHGTFTADGSTFVYQRMNGQNQWWRGYRGGMQPFVSMFNLKTGTYSELPRKREMSAFPMSVGNSIYYISDKNARTMNLYRYDLGSKSEKQLTSYSDAEIRWPTTDGKSVVFERDGLLYRYAIANNAVESLKPPMSSDNWTSRSALRPMGGMTESFGLSPSGARLAVVARGEVFSVPAKNGETRNLTESAGARERLAAWTPDGKNIVYFSDISGENCLYMRPQMGGDAIQLTTAPSIIPLSLEFSPDGKMVSFRTRAAELYVLDLATKKLTLAYKDAYASTPNYDWSPDSKWIAYIETTPNQFGRVAMYEVATGKSTPVNDGLFADSDVAFDVTGKYLYFVSNRTFNPSFGLFEFSLKVENAARIYVMPLTKDLPNPLTPPVDEEGAAPPAAGAAPAFKIDWEGLSARAIALPVPPANYGFAAGLSEGVLFVGPGGVQMFSARSRDIQTVLPAPMPLALNHAKNKIAFMAGADVFVQDLRPGLQPGPGRVNLGNVEATHDPKQEWKQMFWEAWRSQRDLFYNPSLNGVDWGAQGKRYASYLDSVQNRNDLSYVLGLLIGELGTGHAYINAFGSPLPNPVATGLLGADFEVAGGKVRFKKIYRGFNYEDSLRAPLGEPGIDVKVGEYLLAIDGKPVDGRNNPNGMLLGKAGKTVVLSVGSSPSMTGARQVRVKPVADESGLRYAEWVENNRKTVDRLSGGRIGYMHITNTSTLGAIGLIKGYYSQTDKEAMLVDERFNGGGFIQPWFVDTLARTTKAKVRDRNGADWQDAVSIEGPMCLLINGYAGSGGDFFPWLFRQAKRGPLIGTRTWGGLVGIKGYINLLDGGGVSVPEFGIYDHKAGEWIAENKGVDPDIEVDARPDLVAQGKDPQLEKGVEYLMNELKKPRNQAKSPKFPTIPPSR